MEAKPFGSRAFHDLLDGDSAFQLDAKLQYEEIREMMNKENPLITQVFEMKDSSGLSNEEIAAELEITKRQTYYLYSKSLAIGQKYNRR